jgi:hypothetical protein
MGQNRVLGAANSTSMSKDVHVQYISTLVTQKVHIATYPQVVTAIIGATRVAGSGGACTMAFYKAASGVAVGSGTLLHSGSFDLVGTADTNQTLTLVSNPDSLKLAVGDSIGYVLTGTATSAVGSVTITVEPLN